MAMHVVTTMCLHCNTNEQKTLYRFKASLHNRGDSSVASESTLQDRAKYYQKALPRRDDGGQADWSEEDLARLWQRDFVKAQRVGVG